MTSNQIERYKTQETLKEQKRSNLEKERQGREDLKLKRRGQNMKLATDIAGTVGNVIGSAGSLTGGIGKVIAAKNDPSWYNYDKQLVDDVARLSFGTPLGSARTPGQLLGQVRTSVGATPINDQTVPGIMALYFTPTPGYGQKGSESDAVNIAAKNIYSYVRYANSGSRNYEAVDLMLYLLSMDTLISYRMYLCRIYSILRTAKSENRYYPDGFRQLFHLDADIYNHLAELRQYINMLTVRINSFYIPNDLPLMARHAWLNANIFKDNDIKRSQEYIFIQREFWLYQGSATAGGYLRAVHFGATNTVTSDPSDRATSVSFGNLVQMGNTLVDALIAQEDIGIMSGDILKAYGESAMLKLESIPDDFHIESVYSAEVLSQINAATVVGEMSDSGKAFEGAVMSSASVIQDAQGLLSNGYITDAGTKVKGIGFKPRPVSGSPTHTYSLGIKDTIINMYKDSVTPDDVMVATRLVCGLGGRATLIDSGTLAEVSCGSEIVNTISVFANNINGADPAMYENITMVNFYDTNHVAEDATLYEIPSLISTFDWAPRVRNYLVIVSDQANADKFLMIYDNFDVANYASCSYENLNAMHGVAALSLYKVPVTKSAPVKRY